MPTYEQRPQTTGEEIANSISHAVGLVAAAAAVPVLVIAASRQEDPTAIVGASVFAATLVLLYLASMLYHATNESRAKERLQLIDHCAIFLLIAGTYTPFTLGVLRGGWGWSLFAVIWGLGLTGILIKIVKGARFTWVSVGWYLAMGWLVIVAIVPISRLMPSWGIFWLAAGGVAYTVGVLFFWHDERVRYGHFLWHLCVLAGSSFHFIAVLHYAGYQSA